MNPIRINRMAFSPVIWAVLSKEITPYILRNDEELVAQADYKTGSLGDEDCAELRGIVRHFKPKVIAEVGTYIGRSTRAMADGMSGGVIYTCDASNDIKLPDLYGGAVEQFPKQTSTQMFTTLVERGVQVDLFYLDGRLAGADTDLMANLSRDAVIVLDDFEGIEKGVANASLLLSTQFAGHILVYPRPSRKTALLLPQSAVQFVAQ